MGLIKALLFVKNESMLTQSRIPRIALCGNIAVTKPDHKHLTRSH